MSYNVSSIALFDRQAKRLAKKYPSFKRDLAAFSLTLATDPAQGTPLGNNFYKVRFAIESKGKGKSGGARILTYLKVTAETVFLASIYDKSEKATLSDKELDEIFKLIP
jgi:hypothetical protein